MEAGGRGRGGGEGRADRCTGRRRIDLGVAHNFPLRSPFDPASVYGNRSSSSLIVDVFSAPRPLACQWPPPNQISRARVATTRSHTKLFSSKSSSTRVQGGWGHFACPSRSRDIHRDLERIAAAPRRTCVHASSRNLAACQLQCVCAFGLQFQVPSQTQLERCLCIVYKSTDTHPIHTHGIAGCMTNGERHRSCRKALDLL